ncbi:hypothetical protein VNO80_04818 [Phaseolus coccineus]|uniref:Uncharacterized protein n=1 Tax=Phaseolus coccineus TaxID=3886 RepID=A0AAN9NVJ9_PHACN
MASEQSHRCKNSKIEVPRGGAFCVLFFTLRFELREIFSGFFRYGFCRVLCVGNRCYWFSVFVCGVSEKLGRFFGC